MNWSLFVHVIVWHRAMLIFLSVGLFGTNCNVFFPIVHELYIKNMYFKALATKPQPFCPGVNVLICVRKWVCMRVITRNASRNPNLKYRLSYNYFVCRILQNCYNGKWFLTLILIMQFGINLLFKVACYAYSIICFIISSMCMFVVSF